MPQAKSNKKLPWSDVLLAAILIPMISLLTTAFNENNSKHDPKTDLYWLIGTWKTEGKKEHFEKWDYGMNALTGKGYSFKKDKEEVFENLSITSQGHTLFYHAEVLGQNDGKTITYKLTKADNNSFTFINLEHDFPQEITYTKVSNDEFTAVLSTVNKSPNASVTINFKRVQQ